ncbi:hypothetical protein HF325_001636 [Metschnikowia pulcherrima]|uniref:Uncharacterized protein n=1 Tax=Metschnikowia pulcherrima TaxID=27326 RepID=A0A8H7GVG1_9ASCO|nr:hypothetical protein HF325_001636 [Metschnikowia pulcherrima]
MSNITMPMSNSGFVLSESFVLPLGAIVFIFLLLSPQAQKYIRTVSAKNTSQPEKVANTPQGMPKPTPLMITPEQVKNYDDRPWRPFRWPYHQTMSIYKLDVNHWLDMDKYYWHYIEEKKRIWHKYGKQNIDWLPESYDACFELMETVADHMVARYPLLFTVLADKKDKGKIVRNEMTKEILDMTLPLKDHPLLYVTKMAKEDFYIVLKNPKDGMHYLVAAAVPFPGGSFGIDEKIGKHLDVIHDDVPYYHEKLKRSMERWFERLEPSSSVERASWYITWDHKLKVNNIYQLPKFVPNLEEDMKSTDPKEFNAQKDKGIITEDTPVKTLPSYPFAHWANTDFDYVNGWSNPKFSSATKPDYRPEVEKEVKYGNE